MRNTNSVDCSTNPSQPRRDLLVGTLALCACSVLGKAALAAEAKASRPKSGGTVTIETFSADGMSQGKEELERVAKSDQEWRHQLSADAYLITRREGTEPPFTGKYLKNHAEGVYSCICCATALFDAKTKFESGTGWPSFYQPISALNVLETPDNSLGMQRIAVSCNLCNAHLGHVFEDGPRPTGLRYCMNSVALNFTAKA